MKLSPSQSIWPWLIEYAAQTLLHWRVTGRDGLTAIQRMRMRGRSTAPRPRLGEKVLYKVSKTVRLGKAEARWRYGIWYGSIEASDEHLLGTELGVIKARPVTAVREDQRFDGKAIDNIQGTPRRPSTKQKGTKIRSHIDENPEDGDADDEAEDDVQVEVYEEEDQNETIEDAAKQQAVTRSRVGESCSFYIKARDVAKYGTHAGCLGRRLLLGEVATQCGHNRECKSRMTSAMEADKDDKHRIRRWYAAKGIDDNKMKEEKSDEKDNQAEAKQDNNEAEMRVDVHESKRESTGEDERMAKKGEPAQDLIEAESLTKKKEIMRKRF